MLDPDTKRAKVMHSKGSYRLNSGQLISWRTAGAGGSGNVLVRPQSRWRATCTRASSASRRRAETMGSWWIPRRLRRIREGPRRCGDDVSRARRAVPRSESRERGDGVCEAGFGTHRIRHLLVDLGRVAVGGGGDGRDARSDRVPRSRCAKARTSRPASSTPTATWWRRATTAPAISGSMAFAVRRMLQDYPIETLNPGDAVICNDPGIGSGHLPDVYMMCPVYLDTTLLGFAVNISTRSISAARHPVPDHRRDAGQTTRRGSASCRRAATSRASPCATCPHHRRECARARSARRHSRAGPRRTSRARVACRTSRFRPGDAACRDGRADRADRGADARRHQ